VNDDRFILNKESTTEEEGDEFDNFESMVKSGLSANESESVNLYKQGSVRWLFLLFACIP
jgi:hypothetical protein